MYCYRKVTDDLYWVGGNDRRLALFENIHPIPEGVSYNSYLLLDEKTVLFDAADWAVGRAFLENVTALLNGRPLDYLVVQHVEPDHAATIGEVLLRWPDVRIIGSPKALQLLHQFRCPVGCTAEEVREGETRCFGRHTVAFYFAPMVHWPEVMVTYDRTDGVLFSADAFGTFGALDGHLFADEVDFVGGGVWLERARRYYANIVGKYGLQTQALLKKAGALDLRVVCPLHGPVWRRDIPWLLEKYRCWSSYAPEEQGVVIVYASMYGDTENAAEVLAVQLAERGITNVRLYDVSSVHVSYLISEVFRCSHLVLASVTYNLGIFPPMHDFLMDMKALNVQNRTCAILENGSWAPRAGALMQAELEQLKHMTLLEPRPTVASTLQEQDLASLETLADAIAATVQKN